MGFVLCVLKDIVDRVEFMIVIWEDVLDYLGVLNVRVLVTFILLLIDYLEVVG